MTNLLSSWLQHGTPLKVIMKGQSDCAKWHLVWQSTADGEADDW